MHFPNCYAIFLSREVERKPSKCIKLFTKVLMTLIYSEVSEQPLKQVNSDLNC